MRGISYFLLSAVIILLSVASISSCEKDKTMIPVPPPPEQCPDTISFSGFVEPLIVANCSTSGCHDAATSSGTYNLEGYDNIEASASAILTAIKHEGSSPMPLGSPKLSDTIIQQFDCWVVQGKLNN